MTYIIFLFAFLAISFLVLSYKNRYTIFLATMVVSIAGMLFSTLNMIYKTGRYTYTTKFWSKIDRYFFLNLTSFSLGYNNIIRMYNIFLMVFMISIITFTLMYFGEFVHSHNKKGKTKLALFCVFPIAMAFFYDPKATYLFYTYFIVPHNKISYLIYAADSFFYLLTFFYTVFPFIFICRSLKKSSPIKRKRALAVSFSIVIIDIFFLFVILVGLYRKPYIFDNRILSVVQINNVITPEVYFALIVIGILLVTLALYTISKHSISSKINFFKNQSFKRNLKELNQNYINVFHSVKNIIYSYKILLEHARMQTGDEKEKTLDELEAKINDYINRISLMLNIENGDLAIELEPVSFKELIDKVLAQMNFDPNIKIKECINSDAKVNMDTFYMTDALINIIKNAEDAIKKTKKDGVITLTTDTDGEWSILKISDTGTGMTRREISNLFKPFYTTKSRITNWGIGLSFAYRIIKYHNGYISVESTLGFGTNFYIYLPAVND